MAANKRIIKGDHSFQGDSNVSSGNEVGSGNQFNLILGNSSGVVVVLLFAGILISVIVYMAVAHGSLLSWLVSAAFILLICVGTICALILIICRTGITVSNTLTAHKINTQRLWWSEVVHQLPSGQVAAYDRETRKVEVHSVRDIQEHRNYQLPPHSVVESNNIPDDRFPSSTDLTYTEGYQ